VPGGRRVTIDQSAEERIELAEILLSVIQLEYDGP
jgi:hypothetical protein